MYPLPMRTRLIRTNTRKALTMKLVQFRLALIGMFLFGMIHLSMAQPAVKPVQPAHPVDPVLARSERAASMINDGDLAKAETEFRKMAGECERARGPYDPATLNYRIGIVRVCAAQGNATDQAVRESRDLLRVLERELGPVHPATMVVWQTLGEQLAAQGNLRQAAEILNTLLQKQVRALDEQNSLTLKTRFILATIKRREGSTEGAEKELLILAALHESTLGLQHEQTVAVFSELASVLASHGKNTQALDFARRAYEGAKKKLGEEHPTTKACLQQWKVLATGR